MERLVLQYQSLEKALKTLDFALNYPKSDDPNLVIFHRDALIQRFEYCYDLSWKYLKEYLRVHHGLEVRSPKAVFQECLKQGLVNESEAKGLLEVVDARNLSTHLYHEETALALSEQIPVHAKLLKEVVMRTKPFVA